VSTTSELDITQEELLSIIADYEDAQSETVGITRRELQEVLEWGDWKMANLMRRLIKENVIEPVYVGRANTHGERIRVKGYKLTEKSG
jgi:exoribonuclease II